VRRALQFAVALAEESKGKITLFYVLGTRCADGSRATMKLSLTEDETRCLMEHLVDVMARWAIPRSVEFEKSVEIGRSDTEAIVQAAHSLGSDLIVMGKHDYSWCKHLEKAAATERVVRTAPCAVLSVPEEVLN
jgi:nucleotide-binding universal stress UspA family protein